MAYKIGTLTVQVAPGDESFEEQLRAQVKAATDKVDATVGLRLNDDAVISLNEDVNAAMDLATEDAKAKVGLGLRGAAVGELDAEVKAGVDFVQDNTKIRIPVDPKTSKDVQEGLSAMIVGGLAAGAALAPGLILSAASIATVGLGALVAKSNADVDAEYQKLATDVGSTLATATAPLVPAVEASLVSVDGMVKQVAPDLKALFTDAEPDLFTFTQGIGGAAEQFLPRFQQAVANSRGIVADFSQGLPALAAGAGDFFTGLTTDSQATGRGFEDFERLTGTALGTAGQVIGSFSAAASSALDAIVPAADGVLTVIEKIANPVTVGAAGGALGAKLFGSNIQSGLQSISNGLFTVASRADGAGGLLGKVGSAAESASGGFGAMADVMGGPWGIAVGAGIGLLGGLVSGLRDSVASASDFTAAIAQDSGQIGANTEAVIQQVIAKTNLSAITDQLNFSQEELIAYAAGDTTAQQNVTEAYNQKTSALNQASDAEQVHSKAQFDSADSADHQAQALDTAKSSLDQITSAVAQAVQQQNTQTAALVAAQRATDVFTASVTAERLALASAAETALVNATALNQSLPVQGELTSAAINASLAYQQTTTATNAYTSALDALYGKYGDATAAEAAFTTQLAGLKGQLTSGKDAVDASTAAGAKNITALQGAAQAAENYSEKLYQQTGSADQANEALRTSAQRIDDAARAAGFTKTQIQQMNTELFGVPDVKDIKIALDDTAATAEFNSFIKKISNRKAYVDIVAMSDGTIGNLKGSRMTANATGGSSYAGVPQIVGDAGRAEVFVPKTDGYIYPSVTAGTQAVAAHNAQVAGSPAAHGPITFVYNGPRNPDVETWAMMKRDLAGVLGAF